MALELADLSKRFGPVTAVAEVSFQVEPGTVFGFLGSNGAGKTTTLRMVMGILMPDSGNLCWRGQGLRPGDRQRFGYLPEERGLYPKMRVGDHLVYLGRLKGMSKDAATRAVDHWLERLDIGRYRLKRVEQLSKGNQQKVQLAAALLHQPELLILDEPFSGLDPVNAQLVLDVVADLRGSGVAILFSSHEMELVERICSHVALIHDARLLLCGSLRAVRQRSGRQVARVEYEGDEGVLDRFPDLQVRRGAAGELEITWPGAGDDRGILQALVAGGRVRRWELGAPSLREIYVESVGGGRERG